MIEMLSALNSDVECKIDIYVSGVQSECNVTYAALFVSSTFN